MRRAALVASSGVHACRDSHSNPIELPVGADIVLHEPALLFAATVSVLTTLVFALMPALRASRIEFGHGLKAAGHGGTQHRASRRLVSGLVAIETALSVALLVGAGLLIQSVLRMTTEPLGFNPDGLVTTAVGIPERKYPDAERQGQFFDELEHRVSAIPGISGVALGSQRTPTDTLEIEGQPVSPPRLAGRATMNSASLKVLRCRCCEAARLPIATGRVPNPSRSSTSRSSAYTFAALIQLDGASAWDNVRVKHRG